MKDPREWSCTDDSPQNNGWGYNWNYENDDGVNYSEDEPEEIIGDEDWIVHDDDIETDWKNS